MTAQRISIARPAGDRARVHGSGRSDVSVWLFALSMVFLGAVLAAGIGLAAFRITTLDDIATPGAVATCTATAVAAPAGPTSGYSDQTCADEDGDKGFAAPSSPSRGYGY